MKTINLTLISITALFITSCTEEASINISGSAPGRNEINKQIESHKVETMAEIIDDDLPIIKAIGGDGKSIDWEEIEKENLEGDYGPDYFYNDCAQGIEVLQISSRLSNQGNSSYGKDQLTDDDPKTAWVEGKADYGIGESFTVKGFCPNTIYNGYQSSPSNWKNNSRVKRFKIYVNNSPYAYLDLTDEMGIQRFDGPYGEYEGSDEFKFEIVDVYKGVKWSDVAISHIDYIACCFALETEILASDINKGNLKEGDNIYTVDISTGEISEGSIQKMSSEKHVNVVDLHTANHNIKITKNHPLFFENIGFISLEQLQKNLTLDIYSDLSRYPRVLTINKTTKEIEYEKLTRLIDLNDVIKTYTIRKVSNNSNYIANGFICKPY
ncbi:MAG: hypothetical protein QNK85_03060 [Crocinitomicaceae bacterium]